MTDLSGTVALVTGATRGVGLGIARELGMAGATVYVTGRSRRGDSTTDDLPGTVEGAAAEVTEAGGTGVGVVCDHTDDEAVAALAGRIGDEAGRLDLLVNNVWGGYEQYDHEVWTLPVWEQPVWRWDRMMRTGLRAHYTTTRAVLPLMFESDRPLIVTIAFGDDGKFLGDVQYDVAKAADTRLAFALGRKLRKKGVASVAVFPGFTRTERVLQAFEDAGEDPPDDTHSARFVGRGVVALASDPDVLDKTGEAWKIAVLAREYGFLDVDGSLPEPFTVPDEYAE